ncbi:hypothetical protein N866_06305, partial [Actinotalea ferrariae CF5-4]
PAPVPGRVESSPWWPFAADGGLAVVGPGDRAAGVVRAMLADALADATLPLAVLQPAGSSWGWLRWTGRRLAGRSGSRVARTSAQAEEVLAGCTGRVLVLDAHGASRRPALHRWWVRARAAPAGLLLLEDLTSDLPVWCPWVLEVREVGVDGQSGDGGAGPEGPGAVLHGPDGSAVPVLAAGVTEAWAEQHARRCAALPVLPHPDDAPLGADGASPDGRVGDRPDPVPVRVSLEDLGLPTTRGAVLRTWSAPRDRRRLDLLLGADERGSARADLVAEGPHVLVAGTTGAGKSELLQTLLLSLALTHPPAEVAMVLLDYKGGAGFGRTRDLPHVAGMVTDLDPVRAARALEGLRTELRRREALLAAADVTDVAELPQAPPRLLVVVDEFRALVEDLPEFVPALVRTATQGRSLGVHLVLATQRPSGVVDAQLRANLPLRVCLRVTDPADSLDVVDVPDAAGISARTPGRAVVSRPGGTAEVLQTAWAALPGTARAPATAAVRPGDPWATWSPWRHPDAPIDTPTHGTPSPDVVDHLVREVDAAHRRTGRPAPVAPWLPALPERLAAADLPGLEGLGLGGLEPEGFEPEVFEPEDLAQHAGTPAESTPGPPPPPFAVRDLPDLRRRDAVHWDRRGHLAVVGGPGSGRTTALRTLAAGALATGAEVHVLTAGSEADWRGLDRHPGMGTVVGPHDPARALSLVDGLLAGGGAQRAAGPAHGPVGLVPVGLPPVGLPPVGLPPVGLPPVGLPPVGLPPVGLPPVGLPPVGLPPVGLPPVGLPPVGLPPVGLPPVGLPPVGLPPVGLPPVGLPPVGLPPVGLPPVGLPPVGLPPVGLPPVGLPPVGLPPVGLSPAGRAGVAGARTVLCLDDVAGLVRSWDLLPRAPGADVLDRLVREARACGVALAATALPADAHRLLRHASERVLLRVDDVHDALALGVPRTLWDGATPPGRGVHVPAAAGTPRACQVVLPPEEPSVPGAPGSSRPRRPLPGGPVRLVALPDSVRLADLDTGHHPHRDRALLGVGGDDAGPVLLPVTPAVLVVGPARSGRTTTLRTLAHGLRRQGRPVHTDPARVLALVDAAATGGPGFAGGTSGAPGPVVVVDDVELLLRRRPGAEEVLVAWVEAAEEGRADLPLLVTAARTDRAAAAYRGLLAALRGSATLVVLAPGTPGSAELAGTDLTPALDPLHPARPGRAALVTAGRVARVQVATP